MKNMLTKWLAALLIAALLLTPVAMMEEAPTGESVAAETETQTEDMPEDVPDDVPAEAEDVPEEAVIPEALDAVVTEEAELALDEALDFDISNILLPDLLWLDIIADQHLTSIKIGNQTKLEGINLHGYGKNGWTNNVSGDLDLTGCPSMRYAYLGYFNSLKRILINPNSQLNNLKFDGYFTEGESIPLKKAAKHYKHRKYGWEGAPYGLTCPHNTKLITNTYIPASGVEQIAVAGRRAKATVNVGASFQINPGGYKWKSSNKKVATVKNGVVTFKKKGKVTITCTAVRGKKKARVKFAVSK